MQSPRAPLYVFFAAFLTFLVAFAGLLVAIKPELDKRRAAEAGGATPSTAAPDDPAPKPASTPASTTPAGRKDERGSKPASVPIDVTGKVVDPHGAPAPGAQVHILVSSRKKEEGAAWPLLSKPVGRDGTFTLHAAIPPGGAFLQATAPGFLRSDTKTLSASTPTVDAGSLALKTGGTLRVRVAGDEAGKLADAEVTLVDRSNARGGLAPAEVSAKSGSDGVALLRGIDRGTYRVRARAAGHADAESDWRFDGTGRSGADELAFVLLPLTSYVTGSALDRDRTPVTRGEVAVRISAADPPAQQEWRAPVDSQGRFRVGPVPRGTFEVELIAAGMIQKTQVFAEADGDPVELVAEHGGTVVGLVMPVDGSELASSPRITVWRVDSKGRTQPVDSAYHAEAFKSSLKFRVDGLGPGRYYVRAAADGFAAGRSETFAVAVGGASEELVVTLGDGARLSGAVVDARRSPIQNARVTAYEGTAPPPPALADLFPADARTMAHSGADGRFDLELLSPGPIVLVIEAQGQAPRTLGPLLAIEGEELRLGLITLGGGTILSATVADSRNRALPFGRGLLLAADETVRTPFVADEEGNFCLRGLAEGDYVLSGLDGTTGRTELTLRANETGRVQFKSERR